MSSVKADKPAGSQPVPQAKKEPTKSPASIQAPKKIEQKPQEPKKKASGGRSATAKKK